ncbi:CDP-alcohol phosphatidyltransferase family protein [Kiritimatiellota bacterium B12222]|nr:CDP-alcohol phosphatidyltransferase family protein [Kiritimatiellota bacterium B12222]
MNRRPLKTRSKQWATVLASAIAKTGLRPNQISVIGIFISLLGSGVMFVSGRWFLLAALMVQLRLLCNMLDGLIAIEHDKKSVLGDLFNEVPDRIEDSLFLVGAGYASGIIWLGWMAALLSVSTAYLRLLGGSLGFDQDFCGPMAKQHRMFVLTLSLIIAAFVPEALVVGLGVIVVGTVLTVVRRLHRLVRQMEASA